ncbi:TetR/AcrR family transcriptional regulator [Actinomadura parmotrematis]|nr:TetR/AcrR family transcriptional regulator [Actinomadura parmotrematis]
MTGGGRNAILLAARRAFALRPYAEVTLRGVAADAGVSAALIVKHFGTKEGLFEAIADFDPAAAELLGAPLERLGRHMVLELVRARRGPLRDPLLRVVYSLAISDERALLRRRFRDQVTARIAARLDGPDAALRAELAVGLLLGLGATLSLHRSGASAEASAEEIADLYAPGLQGLLTPGGVAGS